MDEQTVNEQPLFEASDVEPVANDTTTEQADEAGSSAVEETSEQTTSENEASAEPAASTEDAQTGDAIDEFLAKKGISKDDPDALSKVAKMYQNVEKDYYSKSQQKAQLERQLANSRVPETNPNLEALSEVRSMRTEMSVERWKSDHNLSAEDEQKMIDYVNQPIVDERGNVQYNPTNGQPLTKGLLVLNGALSLDDVYRLVGGGKVAVDNLKEDLRNEVKKEMEARQAAKRPAANATNSTEFGKPEQDDPFVKAMLGN
jgi:hypothetical protein